MKIHTPGFIFNTAVDFFNVGIERCKKIFSGDYFNDTGMYLKITAPATILAFSMELMLKSILLYRKNEYPKVHGLSELYSHMPELDQNEIERCYSEILVDNKLFPAFRYIVESNGNIPENKTEYTSIKQEIMSELIIHDISFVKWR